MYIIDILVLWPWLVKIFLLCARLNQGYIKGTLTNLFFILLWQCQHCGEGYVTQEALNKHIAEAHSDLLSQYQQCTHCPSLFTCRQSLLRHITWAFYYVLCLFVLSWIALHDPHLSLYWLSPLLEITLKGVTTVETSPVYHLLALCSTFIPSPQQAKNSHLKCISQISAF